MITCTPHASIGRPMPAVDSTLAALIEQSWILRVGQRRLLVRPSTTRDLPAIARLHGRCSARSLLNRYRRGGQPPTVAVLDATLRQPYGIVAATADGELVATGTLASDGTHNRFCVEVGVLVEDRWQRLGIGSELVSHLAGVAQATGSRELIAYPATALGPVQRLMVGVGRTRHVPDPQPHLHTRLSDAAALGIGSVRQRLAAC
jgi:GNAT superfamily N-acetyltransferase